MNKAIQEAFNTLKSSLLLCGHRIVDESHKSNLTDWFGFFLVASTDNESVTLALSITKNFSTIRLSDGEHYFTAYHSDDSTESIVAGIDKLLPAMIKWDEKEKSPVVSQEVEPDITTEGYYDIKTIPIKADGDKIKEDYEIGETCVTWNDWDKYVAANPDQDIPNDDEGFGRGNRPVINVSWKDIQKYIKWLNKVTGDEYALPTEAQWEYACRAGTSTNYYTGDEINVTLANFYNSDHNVGKTTDVKAYPPNQWGLYGMHGGVWDLTGDTFD